MVGAVSFFRLSFLGIFFKYRRSGDMAFDFFFPTHLRNIVTYVLFIFVSFLLGSTCNPISLSIYIYSKNSIGHYLGFGLLCTKVLVCIYSLITREDLFLADNATLLLVQFIFSVIFVSVVCLCVQAQHV